MINVIVADDQKLVRQAVAAILSAAPDIEVVGQAANGREAVELTAELHPDVVVMDIRMPVLDGIAATGQICADEANAGTRVLILTTFEEDDYVLGALRAGAGGFIGKGAEPEEITEAVAKVHAGDALLSPAATKTLIGRYVATPATTADPDSLAQLEHLTERETEVLTMVGRGLSNQEIAEAAFISPHTAKTHVNRIMTKVGAHDRAQLVILAYESGLIVPGA